MEPRYPTPRELVEALQARAAGARAQFGQLLREPLGQLMDRFLARHNFDEDRALLTLHALHAAETYVRATPGAPFDRMTWAAFRGAVLLHVAKVAFQPYAGQPVPADGYAGPPPLPEAPQYSSRTFFRPYERVGNHWFGGDWFGGLLAPDGALWVLIADVTGHGYYAYLLAAALPEVWEHCWHSLPSPETQPAQVLAAMHHLLVDCLPDGVFVECTLARLAPDGTALVAPAGGSRLLLLRRGARRPELLKLRGTWLGLSPPTVQDQHHWSLAQGDELLLASDGVFDQLADGGGAEALALPRGALTLFDALREQLRAALADGPQKDDITMVLLRRRGRAEGEGLASLTEAPTHHRAGDVPV